MVVGPPLVVADTAEVADSADLVADTAEVMNPADVAVGPPLVVVVAELALQRFHYQMSL